MGQTVCACVCVYYESDPFHRGLILWSLLADFFVVNRLQKTETSLYLCVSPDLCSFSSINADKSLSLPSSGELWFLKGFCMFPMPLSVYVEENNISARNKRQIAKDIERKSAKTIAASEAHTDLYKNETASVYSPFYTFIIFLIMCNLNLMCKQIQRRPPSLAFCSL